MAVESLLPLAGSWLWTTYGKSLSDKAFAVGKEKWDETKWNTAAKAYRAKVIKLYNSMQIMGMSKPVPLDDIFTEAYMLDKPTAFGRFDIERLKQRSTDPDAPPINAERLNGLRLVVDKGNLFILGKPGAGKSTFLKYIALKAAEQTIDKVPIFIELKKWADSGKKLLQFMVDERFDVCGFPAAPPFVEELLKSGRAIVLFDGLDEVSQESGQRDKQTHEMNNFIEKYDRTQCLITCRIAASDYSFQPFTYVEIADFTEKQIETFVGNWFRNQEGEKDEETGKNFLTEFVKDDNKGLRDLARTPLLLTLLCLAFNETLTFPRRRVEIYEEALDALLKKWDSSRRIKRDEMYRKLSLGHKENMLSRIAFETFERDEYFIPQKVVESLITDYVKNVPPHDTNIETDGEVVLKAMEAQHGIFVERAREVYSFSHLTFQEYFTAKYIVDNAATGSLANLVKEHCADKRWREVFLLTTSLLADASQFMKTFRQGVDELLKSDITLAGLLAWACRKSVSVQADSWLVRPSCLFVEIFHISVSTGLTTALASGFDADLIMALNLEFDLALNLDLKYVRHHVSNLASVLKWESLHARKLGLSELAKELGDLSIPNDKATSEQWRECAHHLQTLMIKHRDIGRDWNLTEIQEVQLANYLNATRLLLDCLELAFMPPDEKKTMLNSLYFPPAQADDIQND